MTLATLAFLLAAAQPVAADGFEQPDRWTASASDGVASKVSDVPGDAGRALRLDYDFGSVSGYAFAARTLPIDWPANYVLRVKLRGEGGVNDLQLKFTDASGDNVWWVQKLNFRPSAQWQEVRIRPRDLEFAWGPTTDKSLRHTGRMEIVLVRGRDGGKGHVEIDDLTLEPLPPAPPPSPPKASAPAVLDGDKSTVWHGRPGQVLDLDLGAPQRLSALLLDWQGKAAYRVEGSLDKRAWQTLRTVDAGDGGQDPIALHGAESRYLRIRMIGEGALAEVAVKNIDWAPTPNDFISRLASQAPRGRYPRGFTEQPYWTLVGTDGGAIAGLIGEDGAIEPAKGSYSVEPFLTVNGASVDWADVTTSQSLVDGNLPIATTSWQGQGWTLDSTAFAQAEGDEPRLLGRWRIRNDSDQPRTFTLTLAVRPFQVNPPAQFLAQRGGVSPISAIRWDGSRLHIRQPGPVAGDPSVDRLLTPMVTPQSVGMGGFDQGALATPETLPSATHVQDEAHMAQARLSWTMRLPPGETLDVPVAFAGSAPSDFDAALARTADQWRQRLGSVLIQVPPAKQELVDTLRTALADILISRDGPALKPGTRSYNRSWIRDGAMMSDALLRLGVNDPAIAFANWYGGHLFANGKVPCCVDFRGADPVPENDSHGEYIHLLAQLHRYTGDDGLLARHWDRLDAARRYMDGLRLSERTAANQAPDRQMLYGLLPPSISHEAYSAKAQYSLWDDFWGLAGYDGALYAAQVLGKPQASAIAAQRDQFAGDIVNAIDAAAKHWSIDFIPGATSLGDFDATSTTMALEITALQPRLDQRLLHNTFDRQWRRVTSRATSTDWDDYTPYELRNVSAMLRLGQPQRANDLLAIYMRDRRPAGWNAWAEVVGRDPRAIRFLGDLPHAWVASDYIRAALDLFAYEDKAAETLVLGAGMTGDWLSGQGVRIEGLRTPHGALNLAMAGSADRMTVTIGGDARPTGGFVLRWPFAGTPPATRINGRAAQWRDGALHLPATGQPQRIDIGR